jgi:hypothetical protein
MPAKKSVKKKAAAPKRSNTKKKSASPKTRTTKKKTTKPAQPAGEREVSIDRRRKADRRDEQPEPKAAAKPKLQRREKVQRRRQIDPTTCERDYSVEEIAFMNAMDEYKRKNGRMFPTCSEVLEVIRDLGYVQLSPGELAIVRPETAEAASEESAADEDLQTVGAESESF